MNDNPRHLIHKVFLILLTGIVMVACGFGAFAATIVFLMNLGLKNHDNYEYYGQTPAMALVFVAGAVGFLAPGVVVWYLRRRRNLL